MLSIVERPPLYGIEPNGSGMISVENQARTQRPKYSCAGGPPLAGR